MIVMLLDCSARTFLSSDISQPSCLLRVMLPFFGFLRWMPSRETEENERCATLMLHRLEAIGCERWGLCLFFKLKPFDSAWEIHDKRFNHTRADTPAHRSANTSMRITC